MYDKDKAQKKWYDRMMASNAPEDIEYRRELEASINEKYEEAICDCGSQLIFTSILRQCPNGCHLE